MPRTRPPQEVWKTQSASIWNRDNRKCTRCNQPLALHKAHIDHIRSGKLGNNRFKNLRTLCRRCHVLRADSRHRGMIANALRDEIIPPNWRELLWEG